MKRFLPLLLLLSALPACNRGFTDEDIVSLQRTVKAEYEKRDGVKVTDVSFIRESNKQLKGFAKVRVEGLDEEISKSCTATMGDSAQYIWQCE